jgi:hypothetical protein
MSPSTVSSHTHDDHDAASVTEAMSLQEGLLFSDTLKVLLSSTSLFSSTKDSISPPTCCSCGSNSCACGRNRIAFLDCCLPAGVHTKTKCPISGFPCALCCPCQSQRFCRSIHPSSISITHCATVRACCPVHILLQQYN